jgi:hypothetical protein
MKTRELFELLDRLVDGLMWIGPEWNDIAGYRDTVLVVGTREGSTCFQSMKPFEWDHSSQVYFRSDYDEGKSPDVEPLDLESVRLGLIDEINSKIDETESKLDELEDLNRQLGLEDPKMLLDVFMVNGDCYRACESPKFLEVDYGAVLTVDGDVVFHHSGKDRIVLRDQIRMITVYPAGGEL